MVIRNFVHVLKRDDGSYAYIDFKTMTEANKKWLVAFTNEEQLKTGSRTAHIEMTPDEYVPIIADMPFAGIVVNPFDDNDRKIIDKNTVVKGVQ